MDFSNLNKACPKEKFPLPIIGPFVDLATIRSMFPYMDGYNGYNQIRIAVKDVDKTEFRTLIGNFYST